MQSVSGEVQIGNVTAYTTQNRGLNVNELVDMAMRKLINIADTAPPVIREQANEFKFQLRKVMVHYMTQAIKSDRTTLHNKLRDVGFPEVAEIIINL